MVVWTLSRIFLCAMSCVSPRKADLRGISTLSLAGFVLEESCIRVLLKVLPANAKLIASTNPIVHELVELLAGTLRILHLEMVPSRVLHVELVVLVEIHIEPHLQLMKKLVLARDGLHTKQSSAQQV